MPDPVQGGGGVLDSARRMANSVLGLIQNRLSLAVVELQEEKLRVVSLILWLCAVVVLGAAGIMIALSALAIFLWERAGYAGLIGLAAGTLACGAVVLWLLRRRILRGPQPFATTVAEFEKDLECLRPRQ